MTTITTMDIHKILEYLPHRPPFLLIDKVVELTLGHSIVAQKNVTMNEPFFVGHFPNRPVMPGVLIVEALAQASGVLAYETSKKSCEDHLHYLVGIDNARFKRVVEPGDVLRLEVTLTRIKSSIIRASGVASVDGEIACVADLMSIRKDLET